MTKQKPDNIRKPSLITAEIGTELAAIEAKTKPHRDKIEKELKVEKAEQIDYFGSVIADVRKSKQLDVVQFKEWRDAVYELPDDERGDAIEAKAAELGLLQ